MPTVKGSKQHKMVVVPHRPALAWWVGAACVLALGVASGLGYFVGHAVSNSPPVTPSEAVAAGDPEQANAVLRENEALKQQVVSLEQSSAVDKQALAAIQDSLVRQRETIAQLQEDVLFYKQIAEPESTQAELGLVIGQLDLTTTRDPKRLRYKLEFRQQGGTGRLSGHANVNVLGDQDGQRVSLPLSSLSKSEKNLDIPLGFRYFQNVEGELELPEGFTPERVEVLAATEGDKAKSVQKGFGWVVRN
jgi:hypothetical protein